jgi:hypothetical protein
MLASYALTCILYVFLKEESACNTDGILWVRTLHVKEFTTYAFLTFVEVRKETRGW